MKRTLSILLAAVLAASLALPAAAAETTDQRLSQVTQTVKSILDIGDEYTSFYGELEETEFRTLWSLNWEGEGTSLQVTAGEDGTIYRYAASSEESSSYDGSFSPAFPAVSREEARDTAQAFLDRVLSGVESAELSDAAQNQTAGAEQYRFRTALLLHGLPSPIGLTVTVDAGDGRVLRYSRDDQYTPYVGELADPATLTPDVAGAADLLRGTLSLRLEYVPVEDGTRAALRYLPEDGDEYYVQAATGELVNLTQLYADLAGEGVRGGAGDSATAESAPNGSLTEAEQAGIAQMEGVLDRETLDQRARSWDELGLDGYTTASCAYRLDQETGEVSATLRYTRTEDETTRSRTVTLDGKSGALLQVSGSTWAGEDFQPQVSAGRAQAAAEDFLSTLWPEEWKTCALYDSDPAGTGDGSAVHRFVFAQQVNGYFFPTNAITVAVDAADGSIAALYRDFEAHPVFDSAGGILSAGQAMDAWFSTYQVTYGYVEVPEALAGYGEEYQPLLDLGYSYLYGLDLGFSLEQDPYVLGIDAKTGEAVLPGQGTGGALAYSDLEGSWGREQAEELASYGVGWLGGALEPEKPLTQLDLMALLVSADGYLADLSDPDSADAIYSHAYALGLLTEGQREDERPVTRAELVKILLDAGGYGKAAQIPGIYRCTFADAGAIPAEYYGYAAIAQGLGLVSGDGTGSFAAGRTATRLEAVAILYQYMAR